MSLNKLKAERLHCILGQSSGIICVIIPLLELEEDDTLNCPLLDNDFVTTISTSYKPRQLSNFFGCIWLDFWEKHLGKYK